MSENVDIEIEPTEPPAGSPLMQRITRILPGKRTAIMLGAVLGIVAFLLLADFATSAPQMCGSCHETSSHARSWAKSPHAQVSCVACHQPVRKWYDLPGRLADRSRLLNRDITAHAAGRFSISTASSSATDGPVPDENCLQCHDPNRKTTSGLRISINHAAHAKRNGSCVSCHSRVSHPVESRGYAVSFMAQCFTCHGVGADAKAPGTCSLCHPKGYELVPASHKEKKWRTGHGKVSRTDPGQCSMCHTKESCRNCHGVEMPHPEGWAKRAGHSKVAQINRSSCDGCHAGGSAMCTMCHHEGYRPSTGPWVKQHFTLVRERGANYCFDCHSSTYCADCHVRGDSGS